MSFDAELLIGPAASAAGFSLFHQAETGSTNADAMTALARGEDRLWVVADRQSAGRGRQGRGWVSPKGNLYASVALVAPCAPRFSPLLGFVAGLSLAEAIIGIVPALRPVLHLKWPNDALIAGVKCAGILLEGTNLPGGRNGVVIGIGVNVAHRPEGVDQAATALAEHGRIDRDRLFVALADRFSANLALFDQGAGFSAIRSAWLAHALPIGTPLRVRPPQGEKHGRFAGIDTEGALLLETESGIETLLVGDVFALADDLSPERALREGA